MWGRHSPLNLSRLNQVAKWSGFDKAPCYPDSMNYLISSEIDIFPTFSRWTGRPTGKPKTELTWVRCEASALFWSALKMLVGAHRLDLSQRKRESFWHFLLRRHAILPRGLRLRLFFLQCPSPAQFAMPGLSLRCAWLEEERSPRELAQRPSLDTKSLTLRLRHLTFTDWRQHFREERGKGNGLPRVLLATDRAENHLTKCEFVMVWVIRSKQNAVILATRGKLN